MILKKDKQLKRKTLNFSIPQMIESNADINSDNEYKILHNYTKNYVIAVTGMSEGCGCTFIALNLALELSSNFTVALVELDEKSELKNFDDIYDLADGNLNSKKLNKLDLYFYGVNNMIEIFECQYDFIILDTGIYINQNLQEVYRASKKIIVSNSREWKRHYIIQFLQKFDNIKQWVIVANLSSADTYLDLANVMKSQEKKVQVIKTQYIENIFDNMNIANQVLGGGV